MASVSSSKGKKKSGGVPSWLLFPPALLVPIVLLFFILGDPSRRSEISASFVGLVGMIYVSLSLAYHTLSGKGNRKGANAVALLANGALFVFLADFTGGPLAFSWAGIALFLIGLIGAMSLLSPPPAPRFSKTSDSILPEGTDRGIVRHILDAFVFPVALLEFGEDGQERVIASNEPFAAVLGRNADKMQEEAFSSLIPPYVEGTKFKFVDLEWIPRRTTRGRQTLFMLSPLERSTEPPTVQVLDAVDPDTGLYTQSFMEYRGKADVEGCRRYKRRLAISIFQLDFDRHGGIPPSDEVRKTAFDAFGRMVCSTVRVCDSAYRVSDTEIILFMPDTAQQGAKIVTARIRDRMHKLSAMECVELAAAELTDGMVCFIGEDVESLDHAIEEVYLTIGRKRER